MERSKLPQNIIILSYYYYLKRQNYSSRIANQVTVHPENKNYRKSVRITLNLRNHDQKTRKSILP